MICITRTSKDGVWLWVWWFINTEIQGEPALVRFLECRISQYDPSQYVKVRDCSIDNGNLDITEILILKDVSDEASARVKK